MLNRILIGMYSLSLKKSSIKETVKLERAVVLVTLFLMISVTSWLFSIGFLILNDIPALFEEHYQVYGIFVIGGSNIVGFIFYFRLGNIVKKGIDEAKIKKSKLYARLFVVFSMLSLVFAFYLAM